MMEVVVALVSWFVVGRHRRVRDPRAGALLLPPGRLPEGDRGIATAKTAEALHAAVEGLQELVRDYDPYEDPRDLFSEEGEERLPIGPGLEWSHIAIRFQPREEQIE